MSKVNVTVDESRKKMTLEVGYGGLCRAVEIDLTDARSIAEGAVTAASLGDQLIQAKIAGLVQRIESLEKALKEREETPGPPESATSKG